MIQSRPASRSRRRPLAERSDAELRLVLVPFAAPLRPWVCVSAAAGFVLLALGGCAKMDAALSQQWVDVSFRPGTSVAQVLRIRAACSHVPNVTADPIGRHLPALDIVHSVRFNTTRATNANVVELTTCLARFPALAGMDPQDAGDSGG